MNFTSDAEHLVDNIEPEREPSPSEQWADLSPEEQKRVVQLLARVIHKAVLANRDNTPTNLSDELPVDSHS